MENIRVAVVEDDVESREQMNVFLARYRDEVGIAIKISCFSDGQEFLDVVIPFNQPEQSPEYGTLRVIK